MPTSSGPTDPTEPSSQSSSDPPQGSSDSESEIPASWRPQEGPSFGLPWGVPRQSSSLWGEVVTGEPDSLPTDPVDVVIVGGGLVGLTTALALAERGLSSAVLEARRPGHGTTGLSTGKVTLLQGTRAQRIAAAHGTQVMRHYVTANRMGQKRMRAILGDDVPTERDAWTYATDDKGRSDVFAEAAALAEAGVGAQIAEPSELPFATKAAVRLAGQFQVNPAEYLGRLMYLSRAAGVKVVWPCRVTAIESDGQGLMALTEDGATVKGRHVVVATLLPFPLRTALFAAARPSRSYAMTGMPTGDIPQGMYISTGSPVHSFRPAQDDDGRPLLLVGGFGHPTGKGNPTGKHLRELAQWADQTFGLNGFTHRWSAQDFISVDHLPHVGRAPFGPENLLVATGFGKWGFTNGTAAAELLTGIITGSPPEWGGTWQPRLAKSPRGWAGLVAASATVAADLASGWVLEPTRTGFNLKEGEGRVVRGRRRPMANSVVGGQRRACSAVCTHVGGIVRWNEAEQTWDCPLHGSRFAPDGVVEDGPATAPLPGRPEPMPR